MENEEYDYSLESFVNFLTQKPFPERTRATQLSCVFGPTKAIILHEIEQILDVYEKMNVNFIDGKYWVRKTYEEWHDQYFTGISIRTLQRATSELEKSGILLSANYNNDPSDKCKWYTIDRRKLHVSVFHAWIEFKNKYFEEHQ